MRTCSFLFVSLLFFSITTRAQNIPNYVPAEGLVGWWPFTGNAADSSGNGNNGSTTNATLTADRFGNTNSAYAYNGVDSRIDVADAASLRVKKISISVWVLSNISAVKQIVYKASLTAEGEAYSLNSGIFGGAKVGSNCVPAVGWKGISFKQPLGVSAWEHLVFTYDGVVFKAYRNGLLDSSSASSGDIDQCIGGGLRFGFNHKRYFASTGDPFDGVIDDIGIWNRALTADEVKHLYFASLSNDVLGNVGINTANPQRSLQVTDVLRLTPRSFAPPSPAKGDIYFDSIINKLRVYDGTVWQNCW